MANAGSGSCSPCRWAAGGRSPLPSALGPIVPEALDANAQPLLTMADQKDLQKRHQEDQRQNKRLQQELRRRDKALAEAAALLKRNASAKQYASKKIQAYWGEDEVD